MARDDRLGGCTVGYKRLQCKNWNIGSCLGSMLVAQSWDQCGCHVTWIITCATGMDQSGVDFQFQAKCFQMFKKLSGGKSSK